MRSSRRIPWWLVPNLLAIDAPLVAGVWQRFFADRFRVVLPWSVTVALAGIVWFVYLLDRLLDGHRGMIDAERHQIAAEHPQWFVGGMIVATIGILATATRVPITFIRHGAFVGVGVALYLILVHVVVGGIRSLPGTKELLVGICFAAGVAVPLTVGELPAVDWLPAVLAFGGLCWWNCRLIDRWESDRPLSFRLDGTLFGTLLLASTQLPPTINRAVALAAIALLVVHLVFRDRPRLARVLVDVALLSPLLYEFGS